MNATTSGACSRDATPCEPVAGDAIAVELAWVDGASVRRASAVLRAGATLGEAIAQFAASGTVDPATLARATPAVFARARAADYVLHDGDRIELLGPLRADPKDARRQRVAERRASGPRDKWRGDGTS